MKKLMFTLAIVSVAFTSAQAQKQLGGEHNVEVSFNPFADNPINASVIKYRNFLDDDAALRVSLSLNSSSQSFLVVPESSMRQNLSSDVINNPDLFLSNSVSNWNLSLGYEKHFNGMDALSPYVAVQAGYGSATTTLTRDHYSAQTFLSAASGDAGITPGYWVADPDVNAWVSWDYTNEVKSTQLNFDVLFGADYYFSDAIYVGFEAGLRYMSNNPVTSSISASNAAAFNMYFDSEDVSGASGITGSTVYGGSQPGEAVNDPSNEFLVTYGEDASGNISWIVDSPVDFTFNGEPDPAWNGIVNELWSDWSGQSPLNNDRADDPTRDLFRNSGSFLGTYSTGMLRIGFLID